MLSFLFIQEAQSTDWAKVVWTVLTKKGKELTVINDLSDAIIHGRSGCGKTVPAGPGVLEDIRSREKYQKSMMGSYSIAASMVRKAVKARVSNQPNGNIIYDDGFKPTICFECDTLGNFCGMMAYNATYSLNPSTNKINVNALISYSGVDPWDFEEHENASGNYNYWHEVLPAKLVNMIGDYRVFNITYNLVENVTFDFE